MERSTQGVFLFFSEALEIIGNPSGFKFPRMDKVEMLANSFGIEKSDLIEEDSKVKNRNLPSNLITPAARPIPILGTICAGDGIVANEHFVGQFFIDSSVHADYALKVKGDSMIDAEKHTGGIFVLF